MRITAIRVRKLVSGPGYNNHAVEVEASIEGFEDPSVARERLSQWVDAELARMRGADVLQASVAALREEYHHLDRTNKVLKAEVEATRKIIMEHDELRELAAAKGIDALKVELPF